MNARFWAFVNDGWVKLTLRHKQTLRHAKGGRTDEGYHSEGIEWSYDGEEQTISRCYGAEGRDCDGRYEYGANDITTLNLLKDVETHEPGIFRPEWIDLDASQRDYFAEAAGY